MGTEKEKTIIEYIQELEDQLDEAGQISANRAFNLGCWFGLVPAINRAHNCGYLKMEKLKDNGKWEKPKILIDTVGRLFGVYKDVNPVFVWQDLRLHKSRACGYIPLVGCIDSTPFRGPTVIYAGEFDVNTLKIKESIISYKN